MSAKTAVVAALAAVAGLVVGAFWASEEGTAGRLGEADAALIRAMLQAQDEAWNAGDLDGFMRGYWRDEELTFYSAAKVEKGYEPLRERYRKKYQAAGKKDMGKLTFSDLDVQGPRGAGWATARGRWKVEKDGKATQGLFTLVLRRIGGEWKIVHDHTSEGER